MIYLKGASVSVVVLSEQAPFTSEFVASILAITSYEKRLYISSAESRGFSPGGLIFLPHREKVDRVG